MFINYFTGPGLVRLYWLELLTETVGRPQTGRVGSAPPCPHIAWLDPARARQTAFQPWATGWRLGA